MPLSARRPHGGDWTPSPTRRASARCSAPYLPDRAAGAGNPPADDPSVPPLTNWGAPGTTLHGLSPKLKADGDAPTAAWCERGASWRKRAPKGSVPREGAVIREHGRWKAAVRAPASRRSGHGQGGVRAALGDACPRGVLRSAAPRRRPIPVSCTRPPLPASPLPSETRPDTGDGGWRVGGRGLRGAEDGSRGAPLRFPAAPYALFALLAPQ